MMCRVHRYGDALGTRVVWRGLSEHQRQLVSIVVLEDLRIGSAGADFDR
jgi:hypothetical protein